jgi:hypothetical protein
MGKGRPTGLPLLPSTATTGNEFRHRSEALAAEVEWLENNFL